MNTPSPPRTSGDLMESQYDKIRRKPTTHVKKRQVHTQDKNLKTKIMRYIRVPRVPPWLHRRMKMIFLPAACSIETVKHKAVGFIDLPFEFRILIYKFTLVQYLYPRYGYGKEMSYFTSSSADFPIVYKGVFNLFQVNRQRRSEAVEAFRREKAIVITISSHGKSLLEIHYQSNEFYPFRVPPRVLDMRRWRVEFVPCIPPD
ncbi:MAG: hypothetical protein Q9170_002909 [Blastenia crenularia]